MIFGCQAGEAPRKVLLFSGHMIDAPGRREARFPGDKEPIAAVAIAKTLVRIDAGPGDLAILQRGVRRRPALCRSFLLNRA
jgi:hypothetical protein